MLKKNFMVFLSVLIIFVGCVVVYKSLLAHDTTEKSKEARKLFLKGISLLAQAGGIASLYLPDGMDISPPMPQATKVKTKEDIRNIVYKSVALMKKAVKADPNIKEAYFYIAIAYIRILEEESAITFLYKSIKVEKREESYFYLCGLLLGTRQFDQTLKVANIYLENFPDKSAVAKFFMGKAYFEKGSYEQAVMKGAEIVQVENNSINGHFLLAQSYYMLGDDKRADEEFEKVLNINPNLSGDIDKMRNGLESLRPQ